MVFLAAVIIAVWISGIAILSVQNATPVSLRFLGLESIDFPLGVAIAFSATLGILGGAIVQLLDAAASSNSTAFVSSESLDEDNLDF